MHTIVKNIMLIIELLLKNLIMVKKFLIIIVIETLWNMEKVDHIIVEPKQQPRHTANNESVIKQIQNVNLLDETISGRISQQCLMR